MFKCQALYFLVVFIVLIGCEESVNLNAVGKFVVLYLLHVIILFTLLMYNVYVFIQEQFPQAEDDLAPIIEVLNYDPQRLPLGQNVTVICKTKLEKSVIVWTFSDKNLNLTGKNG